MFTTQKNINQKLFSSDKKGACIITGPLPLGVSMNQAYLYKKLPANLFIHD